MPKKPLPLAGSQHKPLAAIFAGDREWTDWVAVFDTMNKHAPSLVIEGEAPGADRIAGICADALGIPCKRFPADWERYGRAAGPIRNREMLTRLLTYSHTHSLCVFAFHDNLAESRGTRDMSRRARKAGVRVVNVRHKPKRDSGNKRKKR